MVTKKTISSRTIIGRERSGKKEGKRGGVNDDRNTRKKRNIFFLFQYIHLGASWERLGASAKSREWSEELESVMKRESRRRLRVSRRIGGARRGLRVS